MDAGGLQARASRCERTTGAPLLILERLLSARGREPQHLEVAQPVTFDRELLALPAARVDLLDLAQLELEQVELALARARELVQMRQLTARRAHRGPRRPHASRVARCSGPQARSRISSCAAASISLRCSCWP